MSKRPRGNPSLDAVRNTDTKAATAARALAADQRAKDLWPKLVEAFGEGCKTNGEVARWLNQNGGEHRSTARGKAWNHVAVRRVMNRIGRLMKGDWKPLS